jgi:hypothetical protein
VTGPRGEPGAVIARKQKPPEKPQQASHFTWPDAVVLAGAALILPVALYEGNWFFATLGLLIAAVIGARVLVTQWMAKRTGLKR